MQREAGYDPRRARADCQVIEARPLSLAELPEALRDDPDLNDNLELRFGRIAIEELRFRLVEIPLTTFEDYRLEAPMEEFYAELIASDEEWSAMVAEDEVPRFEFHDALRRREITRGYARQFGGGRDVMPIVVDFWGLDSRPDVLDGHHRLAGAFEAGVASIRGFELLDD